MKVLLGVILILVLLAGTLIMAWTVWNFIVETPKQLKRIADELERRNKHGN